MKKVMMALAVLLLVPSLATAGNLSADLTGSGGRQGFASIVTTQGSISYVILTGGIGTPMTAVIHQNGSLFVDLNASFAAGSAAGTLRTGVDTGAVDRNPGSFTVVVTGPNGVVMGELELASGGGTPPPPPPPPPPTGNTDPCVEDDVTACLQGDRFEVRVRWEAPNGDSGEGHANELTSDTAYFWFFNPANVETFVKLVDGCNIAGFNTFWVFAGGLTNLRVEITVRDSETGQVKTYTNPQRTDYRTIADTAAFDTCP